MKIRQGFVSNSSSSSFTCDVCGRTRSVWDMNLTEIGMMQCENGHTVCVHHVDNANYQDLHDYLGENEDARYSVPAGKCPICSLQYVDDINLARYLFILLNGRTYPTQVISLEEMRKRASQDFPSQQALIDRVQAIKQGASK